jgi:hypothetical protein
MLPPLLLLLLPLAFEVERPLLPLDHHRTLSLDRVAGDGVSLYSRSNLFSPELALGGEGQFAILRFTSLSFSSFWSASSSSRRACRRPS